MELETNLAFVVASRCAGLRWCCRLRVLLEHSPLSRRRSFPLMESAEEGVGIFVAQEIGRFVQLESGVEQVVASQLTTRFFQQKLEREALLCEAPLQRSSAQVQLPRHIMYPWALTRKQPLQNALRLLAEGFVTELLGQFGVELRRDHRQQLSVVGDKGQFHIRFAEYQRILVSVEPHRTVEIRFVHFSVRRRSLELHPLGI